MSDSPNPLAELEKLAQRPVRDTRDGQRLQRIRVGAGPPRLPSGKELTCPSLRTTPSRLRRERDRLTADCARKDAALEPFGSALADCEDANQPWPDSWYIWELAPALLITVAHLRAAASARGEGSGR